MYYTLYWLCFFLKMNKILLNVNRVTNSIILLFTIHAHPIKKKHQVLFKQKKIKNRTHNSHNTRIHHQIYHNNKPEKHQQHAIRIIMITT